MIVFSAIIRYLVVSFEAADHAGNLVDQAKVMDQVLQILVQLTRAHVQLVCTETHKRKYIKNDTVILFK